MEREGEKEDWVVASSGGKVLAVGGYLITSPGNEGLVFSVNARLYVAIRSLDLSKDQADHFAGKLRVSSPHFNSVHHYIVVQSNDSPLLLQLVEEEGQTTPRHIDFVENALFYSLLYALHALSPSRLQSGLSKGLDITILGDPQFYPSTPDSKTGLGSSAALTTSLVGALLHKLGVLDIHTLTTQSQQQHEHTPSQGHVDKDARQCIHNIAQYAHFKAQGKIGSGFDISAAVYGSQVFTRFQPQFLTSAVYGTPDAENNLRVSDAQSVDAYAHMIKSDNWTSGKVERIGLPPHMHLMLGDVRGGSKTPLLVAKVTAWMNALKESGQLATSVWQELADTNRQFIEVFRALNATAQKDPDTYSREIDRCSELTAEQWKDNDVGALLQELRGIFERIRQALKRMGDLSGTDIEPDSQTAVLDALLHLPGVLIAGVPGAGGMDAVFAVTLSEKANERVKEEWTKRGVYVVQLQQDDSGITRVPDTHAFAAQRGIK